MTEAGERLAHFQPAARLLRWVESGAAERAPAVMIVAAHLDDEVIGAGAQLPRLPDLTIVHTTDGAPRDRRDGNAAGFASWETYASARRGELAAALRLAGVPVSVATLGFADQSASFHLVELTETLAAIVEERRPGVVITHPYEGGHPDHDATAFAVHAACALRVRRSLALPWLVEMISYHAGEGGLVTARPSGLPRSSACIAAVASASA